MMSIDRFLGRMPGPQYNCFDFCREVWLTLRGQDIADRLARLTGAFSGRRATASGLKEFERLLEPVTPCFVVMQRHKLTPHIGIFMDGRILHLTSRGVQFQPPIVARAYYRSLKYYQ